MKTNTKEIGFEQYIEERLVDDDSYTKRLPSQYDKKLCMDTELVLKFIKSTQSNEWKKLEEEYGKEAGEQILSRLTNEIKDRGTLDVLRQGIKDRGISIRLAFFKPETDFNPETKTLYEGNILSVMRQVKYSEKNENSIDMVLFLNGLPIFTIELKNQLTGQSV